MRRGKRIGASEIAVEPFVLTKQDRPRMPRMEREGEGRGDVVEKRSPMDEIEAERYKLPLRVGERQEERWRLVVRRGRVRLGVKGAPGSGKTFITRHTMASIARDSAGKLERQEGSLDEIEIPIWVTAKALAQVSAREISGALQEAFEDTLPGVRLAPHFRSWLWQAVGLPRAFVVVDALDELLEGDRVSFQTKAGQLDRLSGRVMVTCRTMHWEERKSWLGWGRVTEVELAPFKPRQQREFIRKLFAGNPPLAQSMARLLQVNFALRHACASPLLLTFACLLHEERKVNEGTTYALLYAHMLRKVVSGEWRGVKPPWAGNTVQEEQCLHFLESIAWGLFSKAPQLNRFTLHDWEQAAGEYTRVPLEPVNLLQELEQVGFIMPAGFDEQGDRCWSFVHRTFLEFLAARALSRMERSVRLNEAKKHLWFQPEWLEVLTFLAGLVHDATSLIEAVEEEQRNDDLFRSMLYLKARLVGAAGEVDAGVAKRTIVEAVSLLKETLRGWGDCLQEFALQIFAALAGNGTTRGILAERNTDLTRLLLKLVWDSSPDVPEGVMDVLGGIGDDRELERFLKLRLRRASVLTVEEILACEMAARALASVGTDWAVDRILALTRDGDGVVRLVGAMALDIPGTEPAVEKLLELTRDEEPAVRISTISQLAEIGGERAVEQLLELTHDQDAYVRSFATAALDRIVSDRAAARLFDLLWDDENDVRWTAADALGNICPQGAVERLMELTRCKDARVREAAARALGQTGDERVVERLLDLTHDGDPDVRGGAARALGMVGTARPVDRLLQLTKPDNLRRIRYAAVEALASIGTDWAIERLLELTEDREVDVRRAVSKALGSIGNARTVNMLLGLTRARDVVVCSNAARALGNITDERVVERLVQLTRHKHERVREAAGWALGKIDGGRAVKRLLELTRDWNEAVRKTATRAIWQISWKHKMAIRA